MNPDTPTPNNPPSPQPPQSNTPPSMEPTPTPPPAAPNPLAEPTPTPMTGPELTPPSTIPPVPPRSNKTLIIVIVVIVVLALVGTGIFLAMKLLSSSTTNNNTSNGSAQTSNSVDATTLTSAVLATPESATKGLTKSPAGKNPNAVGYTTADQSCLVAYGTATPDIVADATVSDFVNTYLKTATQDSNTTVTGPAVATPRLLKDATDGNKTYSVPTMHFELAEGTKHGTGSYSLALLKNNSRLIIETLCINDQGAVSQTQMDAMEAIVKQISVTAN